MTKIWTSPHDVCYLQHKPGHQSWYPVRNFHFLFFPKMSSFFTFNRLLILTVTKFTFSIFFAYSWNTLLLACTMDSPTVRFFSVETFFSWANLLTQSQHWWMGRLDDVGCNFPGKEVFCLAPVLQNQKGWYFRQHTSPFRFVFEEYYKLKQELYPIRIMVKPRKVQFFMFGLWCFSVSSRLEWETLLKDITKHFTSMEDLALNFGKSKVFFILFNRFAAVGL